MGLDMSLFASKSEFLPKGDSEAFDKIKSILNADEFMNELLLGTMDVRIEIAYWRKANQVHKFFVDLAGGKDECQDIYVEREDLEELLNRCNTILENRDVEKAQELLPTQSGFFFGSTEYDEYYFEDLEQTRKTLSKILKDAPKDWDFYYRASW